MQATNPNLIPSNRTRVGFTGERGHTPFPLILQVLSDIPRDWVIVTGGCVGVDATVAEVAHQLGRWVHTVIPHPTKHLDPQRFHWCRSFEEAPEGKDDADSYRKRNELMVSRCHKLIAIASRPEHNRSGTWMTVRIARARKVPVEVHYIGGGVDL